MATESSGRKLKYRIALFLAAVLVAIVADALEADAKCTPRAADPLIAERYQGCSRKALISYLYNDLITPYSFTCAKKVSAICIKEGCADPKTQAEALRCLGDYATVLNECTKQVDDAARMARCKDGKNWPIEKIAARYPAGTPSVSPPISVPLPARAPALVAMNAPAAPVAVSERKPAGTVPTPMATTVTAPPFVPPTTPGEMVSLPDVAIIRLHPAMNPSETIRTTPRTKAPQRAPAPFANPSVTVVPLPPTL
jgi:hypothetical protein